MIVKIGAEVLIGALVACACFAFLIGMLVAAYWG